MGRFFLLVFVALALGACVTTDQNPAVRSQRTGQYEANMSGFAKPTAFGVFYAFFSHEAWPDSSVYYFPGTSQDTRYPGQCGPEPLNPNKGDYFTPKGNVRRC